MKGKTKRVQQMSASSCKANNNVNIYHHILVIIESFQYDCLYCQIFNYIGLFMWYKQK